MKYQHRRGSQGNSSAPMIAAQKHGTLLIFTLILA